MSHTLAAPASCGREIKHSRFLATAVAARDPQQVPALLAQLSDSAATHNCWAYRMGAQYRSSDDGEPAGTAGRPILAAIDGQGYDQVLVVVTRWYGGIKLGAGGLIRAYGGAAAECLRLAQRQPLIAMQTWQLSVPFDDLGTVHAALSGMDAEKLAESFDQHGAQLHLRLPTQQVDTLKIHLRDATRNRVRWSGPDPAH